MADCNQSLKGEKEIEDNSKLRKKAMIVKSTAVCMDKNHYKAENWARKGAKVNSNVGETQQNCPDVYASKQLGRLFRQSSVWKCYRNSWMLCRLFNFILFSCPRMTRCWLQIGGVLDDQALYWLIFKIISSSSSSMTCYYLGH